MAADQYPERIGPRVRDEHESLIRRCARLRARLRRGETDHVARDFAELASDLLAHLGLEEHDWFPALAFEAVGGPRLVARLHAEHAEIRKQVAAIDADHLDVDRLDELAALLERHRAREEEHLYPWAIARETSVDAV